MIITRPFKKQTGGNDNGNGGNNGGVTNNNTVITTINNFTGTVINSPVTVNNNTIVVGGGLVLTNYVYNNINYDYRVTNNNEITLSYPVYNTTIQIININNVTNNNSTNFDINSIIKGKYKNDIEARANGVLSGQFYKLAIDNDGAMTENVIKYLE